MKRLARYLPFVIVLVVPMLFYPGAAASTWRSSSDVHAMLEFASSLLAITAGIMVLLHFLGTGRQFFLAISVGLVLIGAEEFVHALYSFQRIWLNEPPTFTLAISATWLAGNLALAISLLIALALGDREIAPSKRILRAAVTNAAVFAAAALLTWLTFISPIPPSFVQLGSTSKKLTELSLALLFFVASVLYANLYVKRQSRSPLLWSIVAFVVFRVAVHLLVFDARAFYDAHWDIAHVVALLSYLFPIFGVWAETVQLQNSAHAQLVVLEKEVTERKRAEEKLRESEERYRTLIQNVGEGIGFVDPEEQFAFANAAAEDIFGMPPGGLLERSLREFTSPEQFGMMREQTDRRQAGEKGAYEIEINRPTGEKRNLLITAVPQSDSQGKFLGALGVFRDITDRKQAEAQLRQSQKMETVGQLAGGVAHDFNNLLTGILGNIALVRSSLPSTDPLLENLNAAETAARQAATLTKGLLTFSRSAVVSSVSMNITAALDVSLALLRQSLPATMGIVRDDEQPAWNVLLDQTQMTQIMLNLVVNARDAMQGKGTVTIGTRNVTIDMAYVGEHSYARAGEFVHLSVTDTGPGMSPDAMQHLFEPFYTTKPAGSGTGLGLPIVYGAVKQAGGWIAAVSAEGVGATFDIYLPRCLEEPKDFLTPNPILFHAAGETVLVVEDEPIVCAVAQALLGRSGYTVLTAVNGVSALNVLREHPADIGLILLDMTMPGMTTDEIVHAIRALNPTIPILLNSGHTSNDTINQMLEEGSAQGFLGKPYTLGELVGKVQELLHRG